MSLNKYNSIKFNFYSKLQRGHSVKIENLKNNIDNIGIGDILESLDNGNYYLITATDGGYGWTDLTRCKSNDKVYFTINSAVNDIVNNYIIHRNKDVKLIIQ